MYMHLYVDHEKSQVMQTLQYCPCKHSIKCKLLVQWQCEIKMQVSHFISSGASHWGQTQERNCLYSQEAETN